MIKSASKVLFETRDITTRVRGIGEAIQKEIAAEDPLVICILSGSVIFAADLLRAISSPLRFEFVHVDFEPGSAAEPLGIHYPIPIDVDGESLLVVKDVVASGVIENYLTSQFVEKGATAVRYATLIDLPKERTTHCQVDYRVFSTERHGRLIGYGMKHLGRYGNLPYIAMLPEEDATAET